MAPTTIEAPASTSHVFAASLDGRPALAVQGESGPAVLHTLDSAAAKGLLARHPHLEDLAARARRLAAQAHDEGFRHQGAIVHEDEPEAKPAPAPEPELAAAPDSAE